MDKIRALLPESSNHQSRLSMHTFELQRNIEHFFAELESFKPFTDAVSALAQSADALDQYLPGLAEGGNKLNDAAAHIHNYLARVPQTTSAINHRQFFRALEHFQRSIIQLQPSPSPRAELISHLNVRIEEFAGLYDAFLSNQSGKHAVPLLLAAQKLQTKLQVLIGSLQLFEEFVGENDIPSSSEAPLALWLPAHLDIADFARRLLALQSIYSELCMLLSVSENDHPLRISKIESGSLWAKVFGESRVVGLMASFIEQTATWIYRTYTSEGKLASVPRKIEAIESLLDLTGRLKEAGLDTSEMQSHIVKSAVAVSKQLAVLLDGQASVMVNDQTISVATEVSKALLERTMPLRLNTPDFNDGDTPPALPPPK